MKAIRLPMPSTQDLYNMFKDINSGGQSPVPFTNVGFYADQLQDFYEANERPIPYDKAMRIARSLRNLELKEHPLYKLELQIASRLRKDLREYMIDGLGEYRTFSEARVKGRRIKFWNISTRWQTVNLIQDSLLHMKNGVGPGLAIAGYELKYKVYESGSYNSTNVDIMITRIQGS